MDNSLSSLNWSKSWEQLVSYHIKLFSRQYSHAETSAMLLSHFLTTLQVRSRSQSLHMSNSMSDCMQPSKTPMSAQADAAGSTCCVLSACASECLMQRTCKAHLQRLSSNLLLLLRLHAAQRAHVMQPVRQLHHNDPYFFSHGQKQLPEVFCLHICPRGHA